MRHFVRVVPVVLVAAALAALFFGQAAETLPLYASRTGLQCQSCHFDPNGGGPRNEFGFMYARNRHELTPEPMDSRWSELTVANRVGEDMPLYFSVNQRFMLLGNDIDGKKLDRLGFFNMENAIQFAFMPHEALVLVYNFDAFGNEGGFGGAAVNRDAFGMIKDLPVNGYIKAGRFRNPFGLRMADHTVATRNAYLEFAGAGGPLRPPSFLPYDPRIVDMGIEVGAEQNGWYGRAAFTNGGSDVLRGGFAETKSIKIGHAKGVYQGAVSFYDNYQKVNPNPYKRMTRWSYFGLTRWGPFAFIGEVAAGTDEAAPVVPMATGAKTNRLAYFAEVDYALNRWVNFRVRYDRLILNRSSDKAVRDANTYDRYALEGEFVPVPFAEIRWTLRRIDLRENQAGPTGPIDKETQGYVQFHFSY